MAQGDVGCFDQAILNTFEKLLDWETDSWFLGLTDGTTTPTVATADPRWAAGGTTNFKAEEVTPGGNYSADGAACANPTVTLNAGVVEVDMDDPATWSQNASNPTNATWGILYNSTDASKRAGCYVDLGGAFNMTTGDLTVSWGAPLMTIDQA